MIVCVAVVGHQNNPLYLQSFTEADDAVKLHHVVHCSLDVIDERVNNPKRNAPAMNETFLGLLYPTENYKVYGYLTNTKVKFIMVTTDLDVKDADARNEVPCCICRRCFKPLPCSREEDCLKKLWCKSKHNCEVLRFRDNCLSATCSEFPLQSSILPFPFVDNSFLNLHTVPRMHAEQDDNLAMKKKENMVSFKDCVPFFSIQCSYSPSSDVYFLCLYAWVVSCCSYFLLAADSNDSL